MNLYVRVLFLLLRLWRLERRGLLEASRVAFRVWPTDCDINLHMNNGRYLTFMDLGRTHLMAQCGMLKVILREKWMPVLAAAEINFIRSIAPLQKFELVTRLLSWDEKYFYMEQRFEVKGVLCAHAYVKGLFLKRGRKIPNAEVAVAAGHEGPAPPLPDEIKLWAEFGNLKKQRALPT